jgi:hypothetical protein
MTVRALLPRQPAHRNIALDGSVTDACTAAANPGPGGGIRGTRQAAGVHA